jgi:ABC-type multidrug transport system fused ATPase/permease subunit
MRIIWKYLKPFRKWIFIAMSLAAIAQILELIDPIIFGKIIDNFTVNIEGRSEDELVGGVLRLLALAIGIALIASWPTPSLIILHDLQFRNLGFPYSMKVLNRPCDFHTVNLKIRAADTFCLCFKRSVTTMKGLSTHLSHHYSPQ